MTRLRCLALVLLLTSSRVTWSQTTGLIPLNDLGTGTYQGFQGGLYTGGVNTPPAAHAAAALTASQSIVPRNGAGNPDPVNGKIAMLSFGMSNTSYEFSMFERQEDQNVARNARVVIINGAISGQDTTALLNPGAQYWTTVQDRVTAMGLTNAQVQAAWFKEAKINPSGGFPAASQQLRDQFKTILQIIHGFFPNLRICYLSSRIYAGYSSPTSINPEPYAYESAFSVKWLIEDQIGGDPGLNYDPANGTVMAPLLLWGAYLWADGTNPRGDGLVWLQTDYLSDFIHPNQAGEQKVADLLSAFFPIEPSAAFWWPKQGGVRLVTLDATDDSWVEAANPTANHGADTSLTVRGTSSPDNIYVRFDASAVTRPVFYAKLAVRTPFGDGDDDVGVVASTSWTEATLTYQNAPAIGPAFVHLPPATHDSPISGDATAQVNADTDGILSFGFTTASTGSSTCYSKEGGHGPRLTMSVPDGSEDYLLGAGLGFPNANEVRVSTSGGAPTSVDFFAYAAGQWGVNVAYADAGASTAILTGPGPGAVYGPQVRGFERDGTVVAKINYYAYGTLRYGVNVAAGNVDADAFHEIVTGAGPGNVFGPHTRGWNFDGTAVGALPRFSFFAYGTLQYGVNVATGNLDADAFREVLTGPGPGSAFGPQVRGWNYDGTTITAISKVNFNAGIGTHGVNVAAGDVDSDGFYEITVTHGPGPTEPSAFQGYNYDGASIALLAGFQITPFTTLYGGRVGVGDVTGDGRAELLTGAGRDPAASSTVRSYAYFGSTLTAVGIPFTPFGAATYGVNVTGAPLQY